MIDLLVELIVYSLQNVQVKMLNLQHFGYVTLFDDDRTVPENEEHIRSQKQQTLRFQVEFFITTEKYPIDEIPQIHILEYLCNLYVF